MDMLYIRETSIPVDEMNVRLEAAAKKHQFGVLHETDLREKMHSKGVEFAPACMVFDVCNPHRAKVVLESNLGISTALPCRISVYEEGGKTKVATLLPSRVLGMFGTEGLDSIAQSVESDLIAIIDQAVAVV